MYHSFGVIAFAAMIIASTSVAQAAPEDDLKQATAMIASNPNNPDAYTKRMNILSQMGRYQEAANDLATQCQLTPDPDVKELCESELSEYKQMHGLR